MSKRYNGWANYETWNVALWILNDEGNQNYWTERAMECWGEASGEGDDRKNDATNALASLLKGEFEENVPAEVQGTYLDLLNAALSEVDWYEIAENFIIECKDKED